MLTPTIFVACALAFGDDVFVVHDPSANKLFASRFDIVDQQAGQALGFLEGSFQKCFSVKGKQPLRAAFAVDADGDGNDEIAFLRAWKQSGKHFLAVAPPPAAPGSSKPTIVTSTKRAFLTELGSASEFLAAGRFDRDGDGADEWIAVERDGTGALRFAVRELPSAKNQEMALALAETASTEIALGGPIVGAFGLALDAVPGDELVLAVADATTVRTVAFRWPTSTGSSLELLADLGAVGASSEVLGVEPARVGEDLAPGILVRLDTALFGPRLESRAVLAASSLSTPVFVANLPFSQYSSFAALGLRVVAPVAPPPPPPGPGTTKTWTLRVYNGNDVVGTFKPGVQTSSSLTFVDDVGTAVTVVPIAPSGYESSIVALNPNSFTWSLKVDGTGPTATIAVTTPLPNGTAGFHSTSGMHVIFGSAMNQPVGTLTVPGSGSTPFTRLWFNLPHN